jgi:LysR family transcriptional regulator, glycine cleavage system transcriptional activator
MSAISSIDSLRCFLAAARALNFRRAAKSVALTPTAFSQRIKSLEDQLGRRLFLRSTRSVSLTAAGLALVPLAERCLQAVADCERVGDGAIPQASMELTLGTRLELGLSWVVPLRKALMRSRPWLQLHLYFGSGPDLLLRVRTMEIDCAITSTQFNDTKLDAFPLHREDYVFVGASSLLARVPLRRPADALQHTLLDAARDLPLFRYWRDADAAHKGLHFGNAVWLGSIAAIRQEVLEGGGVAVLPEYFVRGDLARRKLQRIFPGVAPLHDLFRLVFRASDPRRPVFESLAGELAAVPLR